jgi:hypothetical protein
MSEFELLGLWQKARLQIVLSQMAPTFLLIATVALFPLGLGQAPIVVRLAALGVLLASGILGALVQFGAAAEAQAVAADLAALKTRSATSNRAVSLAPWFNVVKFVTPAVFGVIFLLLMAALLLDGGR